jgi:AraC family L-rhamnose operon regulatory protein RhaS
MSKWPLIYQEQDHKFEADRCEALVRAAEAGQVRLVALARGGYPGWRLSARHLPGLSSVGFWDARDSQNWGLGWHRNEGIEITYLETGRMVFSLEREEWNLNPGDMTITRPWQPHRVGDPHIGVGRLHWFILDVGVRRPHQTWQWPSWVVLTREDMKELTTLLSQNEQPVWQVSESLGACFREIADALERSEAQPNISRMTVYLNELLFLLLEMLRSHHVGLNPGLSSSRRTVELFLEDLRRNPENLAEPWTLESMAERCDLGVTHFGNLCKKVTSLTPVQFLTQYRLETAAGMLKSRMDLTVSEIAFSLGFASSQYFATVFRKCYGCSPSDYRVGNSDA